MNAGVAYLLGVITLPVIVLVAAALFAAFWPDGTYRVRCDFDDYEIRSRRRAVRWISWQTHTLTRKHREGALLGPAWKRDPQPDWYKVQRKRETISTDALLADLEEQ